MTVTVENVVDHPYRWMDQRVVVRAEACALRGELLEPLIYNELMRLQEQEGNGDLQMFVGRVMSESTEDLKDPKLPINQHSIVLEGTSGRNSGRKVKLVVGECSEYILFAGQVIGVLGRFLSGGRELHASKLVCGAPNPVPAPTANETGKIHVAVASGPYSPDNMLLFDSIADLEVRIRDHPPDYLLLLGPFLDANHPIVASGIVMDSFDRPATYEDIYKEEIIPKLARLARACENARAQLIIVPALNETRISFPLPQPPINTLKSAVWELLVKELPKSVQYVSNPATVRIGDMTVLVSSTDALTSINSSVLFKQGEPAETAAPLLSRVDSCLDQLLRSRSLFPVIPSGVRVDPAQRHCLNIHDALPDVIITPSLSGKKFVKKINGRVFVNPGFMSDAAGTASSVAELVFDPAKTPNDTPADRVTGELIKL